MDPHALARARAQMATRASPTRATVLAKDVRMTLPDDVLQIPLAIVFSKASRPAGEAQGGGRGRRGSGRSAVRRSSFAVLAALGPHK